MIPLLETSRLRLRHYTLDDEAALFEVFADADAREFYPQMAERANVRKWIEWNLRNYAEFGFGLWALESKETGRFLGDCGLTYQQIDGGRELEIGYHVLVAERRKGYATEAARVCLDYGFRETPCSSICSIVKPSNRASRAVAGRIHSRCREVSKNDEPRFVFFTPRADWSE